MTSQLPAPLDPNGDPGTQIIVFLRDAKFALARALENTEIDQIVEMHAQAKALQAYATAHDLAKEAKEAAAELMIRTNRALARAVRQGQEKGTVVKSGENLRKGVRALIPDKTQFPFPSEKLMPGDLLEGREMTHGYALAAADDATFESAIETARTQKNVSRANVVRITQGKPGIKAGCQGRKSRWEQLPKLIADGMDQTQIAKLLHVKPASVVRQAREAGLVIHADRMMRRQKAPDPERFLREFVNTIETLLPSIEMVEPNRLAPELLIECATALDAAIVALRQFSTQLKRGSKR